MWVINFNGKNFGAKIFENITIKFLSSLAVLIYIVTFMIPKNTFMYTASVLLGIGSAVLWTALGDFIHMQSPTEEKMVKHTSLFWVLFQSSLVIGNIYIYFEWNGQNYISREDVTKLFIRLSIL